MASISPETTTALEMIIDPMLSVPPFSLGFPDGNNQSNYYPGEERITKEDIATVARVMEKHSIEPENIRVHKVMDGTKPTFEILQASVETTTTINQLDGGILEATVRVKRGDHAAEMSRICPALIEAVCGKRQASCPSVGLH
jgi:dipeptidyl-peptidase III